MFTIIYSIKLFEQITNVDYICGHYMDVTNVTRYITNINYGLLHISLST